MAYADLVVNLVVRGRYLDGSGAELHVDGFVGNDRYRAFEERWQPHAPADELRVTRILRVNRDRDVCQHRLRSGRRNLDAVAPILF